MASPDTEYTINRVKVCFPCKAYPSQLTMMDKIIKCIDRRQNSLLESPTGSGKSLALLCSSLAWLKAEKERIHRLELEKATKVKDECSCHCHGSTPAKEEKISSLPSMSKVVEDTSSVEPVHVAANESDTQQPTDKDKDSEPEEQADVEEGSGRNNESSEDGDFQVSKKRYRTPGMQAAPIAKKQRQSNDGCDDLEDLTMDSVSRNQPEWTMQLQKHEKEGSSTDNDNKEVSDKLAEKNDERENEEKKVKCKEPRSECAPQIFFGTRTHKQIAQIVRELNKTTYNTTKMCILASREHTCIHSEVSESKNKTEDCRKSVEGREGKSCSYHGRVHLVNNQNDLENYGFRKAWDIEELVELGNAIRACPYYITREIMKDADIVFCPYNYLIDPIIRSQMNIDLTDQVVILDEAHNIEDSSRDAASWSVTTQKLEEAMNDLDYFISWNIYPEQHRALHSVCANLRRWILENSDQLIDCDYEKSSKVWDGKEMLQALEELGFTPVTLPILAKHFKTVANPKEPSKKDHRSMNAHTGSVFEGLFMVLSYLLKDNFKFASDYRLAIIKKVEMVPSSLPGGWRRKGAKEKKWVYSLNFWCLSPAVAFSEVGSLSRSVILTSGTLSPMSSFSSELGVNFPIQLEANHVVGKSQVWVSSLSVGPSGSTLNATYRSAETFTFQDEVGNAIHDVCQVVPHGVLCFFPSYAMLDKLMKRWKTTGLWDRLTGLKRTFYELRGGGQADFNDTMDDFYSAVKMSEEAECESGNVGALFLAVCRGKVSEGLDFADNNARAVITVGIPFPNIKDTQVELKRKYNNQYCTVKGLLNGSEWYEIQAFRALNQALGRCIRHKDDWGAILLIDERFGKSPKYRNSLSKWIRNKVAHHNNFHDVLTSLKKFAKARRENPSPPETPGQTVCRTPKKIIDLDETKSNLDSPASVHSDSQSANLTPRKSMNCTQTGRNLVLPTPVPDEHHLTKTPLRSFPPQQVISGSKQNVTSQVKPVEIKRLMGCTARTHEGNLVQSYQLTQAKPLDVTRKGITGNSPDCRVVHRDIVETLGSSMSQGTPKIQRRSLFCPQEIVGQKEESLIQNRERLTEQDMVLPKDNYKRENQLGCEVIRQAGVDKDTDATDAKPRVVTEVASESPALFVTPPSSFGSSNEASEKIHEDGEETENIKDTSGTTEARTGITDNKDGLDYLGQEKPKVTNESTGKDFESGAIKSPNKQKENTGEKEQEGYFAEPSALSAIHSKTSKNSLVCNKAKDLLDIAEDCEPDKTASEGVMWNVTCSCCGATFLSDGARPLEKDFPSKCFQGRILGSLFSLNSWVKKKEPTIKTLTTSDSKKVQGCCSALGVYEGKLDGREFKLNSIYAEEESRCYVPLVCCHCQETRGPRSRINVVAVRAVICGNESSQGCSPVWFSWDKVHLQTCKQLLEPS